MESIRVIATILGLTCAVVDFYTTVKGDKTPLHRAGHLIFGLVFMGLVYVIWTIR